MLYESALIIDAIASLVYLIALMIWCIEQFDQIIAL